MKPADLRRVLAEAIDLAEDGWALAPHAYRTNERSAERLERLRMLLHTLDETNDEAG